MVTALNAIVIDAPTENDTYERNVPKDKTYIDITLFNRHLYFGKYSSGEYVFRFSKPAEQKKYIEYSTGTNDVSIRYSTASYEDSRHNLQLSLGFGMLSIYFPWKNSDEKYRMGYDPDELPKTYGISIYNNEKFYGFPNSFSYYKNNNGKTENVIKHFPWYKEFLYKMVYKNDRTWDVPEVNEETDFVYRTPFVYSNSQDIVQNTFATVKLYKYVKGPKWLNKHGIHLWNKNRYVIDIEFDEAVGGRKESYKGGVFGISTTLTKSQVSMIKNTDIMVTMPKILTRLFERIRDEKRI